MPIDPEVRTALHEIRDLIQQRQLQTDVNTKEIQNLQRLFSNHVTACDANKQVLDKIEGFMTELSVSLKWANRVRAFILWIAAPATALIVFYRSWKG